MPAAGVRASSEQEKLNLPVAGLFCPAAVLQRTKFRQKADKSSWLLPGMLVTAGGVPLCLLLQRTLQVPSLLVTGAYFKFLNEFIEFPPVPCSALLGKRKKQNKQKNNTKNTNQGVLQLLPRLGAEKQEAWLYPQDPFSSLLA